MGVIVSYDPAIAGCVHRKSIPETVGDGFRTFDGSNAECHPEVASNLESLSIEIQEMLPLPLAILLSRHRGA